MKLSFSVTRIMSEVDSGYLQDQGTQGKIRESQGSAFSLKDIREKSGNSIYSEGSQEISGKLFVFVSLINRFPCMLKKKQKKNSLNNKIVVISLHDEIKAPFFAQIG